MHLLPSPDPKLLRLLEEAVAPFGSKPKLLLALSGGPDSMALFYHLLDLGKLRQIEWGVAHVDHGWREESSFEAKQLKEKCLQESIPFYLKTLSPAQTKGNLEEACRKERLSFFSAICKEQLYHAVLMAHQQDDQEETILKRLFEGASLLNLRAIQKVTDFEGLIIVRPWLSVPKKELIAFLETRRLPFFDDQTNRDPRYLRARMRKELIPELSLLFGKNLSSSLLRLGKEAGELTDYLRQILSTRLEPIIQGKRASFLADRGLHPFEVRYLIQSWKFPLSRASLDDLIAHYVNAKGEARFPLSDGELIVDRGRLFYQNQQAYSGKWEWKRIEQGVEKRGWKEVLYGSATLLISEGEMKCGLPEEILNPEQREKYFKRLSASKVPLFLRKSVPCLLSEEGLVISPLLEDEQKGEENKIFLFLCFTPN